MKLRFLALGGGAAALSVLVATPAMAAGVAGTPCTTPGPSNTPVIASTPAAPPPGPGSSTIYGTGSPTSGGYVGISGSDGYLQAGGGTGGGAISGETPDGPGLNGYLNVSTSPGVCVGTNSASVTG